MLVPDPEAVMVPIEAVVAVVAAAALGVGSRKGRKNNFGSTSTRYNEHTRKEIKACNLKKCQLHPNAKQEGRKLG